MTENYLNPSKGGKIHILPLGGCSEFGMNSTLFLSQNSSILVDCGIMFPNSDLLGIDALVPETEKFFDRCFEFSAYVITHGHEDHIGAFATYFQKRQLPVFATPWCVELLRTKLNDKLLKQFEKHLTIVGPGDKIMAGDFEVEYIHVNHSIPDSCSILIKCEGISIYHSGDFKIDHESTHEKIADLDRLNEIGRQGLDLLLCDSTSGQNEGRTGSESSVVEPIIKVMEQESGNVFFTTFSSNLWRVISVFEIAERLGRKVCVVGRGMHKTLQIASKLGYYTPPKGLQIPEEKLGDHNKNLIILATGCQGEKFAAMSRIVWDHHKSLTITPNDVVVFSSRVIPGNEKSVIKIQNEVEKAGGRCITTKQNPGIHVSGHGSSEDVKELAERLKPNFFLPIHGSFSHENNNRLTLIRNGFDNKKTLTIESGDLIEVSKGGKCKKIDHIDRYYLYLDAPRKYPLEKTILNQRLKIGTSGLILVTGAVSGKGNIVSSIDIDFVGFDFSHDKTSLVKSLAKEIINDSKVTRHKLDEFEESVRLKVRNRLNDITGKKIPTIVKLHQSTRT